MLAFEPRAQPLDGPLADPHREATAGALLHREVAIDHVQLGAGAPRARRDHAQRSRIAHAGDDRDPNA